MTPSEYFKRQCYIALDVDEEPAVDVVDKMGADYFVVSTDYPHSDGAFPEAMAQFFGLPFRDEVRRKILWDNCARLYRIPVPGGGRAGTIGRGRGERTHRPTAGPRPAASRGTTYEPSTFMSLARSNAAPRIRTAARRWCSSAPRGARLRRGRPAEMRRLATRPMGSRGPRHARVP